MARLEEMTPPEVRDFVRAYSWHRINPTPFAEMRIPLEEARLGLVAMACMTNPGEPPFHAEEPDNDPSIRIIHDDTDPATLVNTFPGQAFDHAGLQADANLLIPLDRLRELIAAGEIGELAPHNISMCGHLPKPRRLIEEVAPQIAKMFAEDGVNAVLLVPA
jgi:D-proline reductase (dithiol) PrdB